jgi:NADPH:quinone reductase-like Zn-dependent oxidoreductase
MKAIRIEAFGRPSDVLQVADVPEIGPPAPSGVAIAVEASLINPYDLVMIAGNYGYRLPLHRGHARGRARSCGGR